jgi:cytochrome P450
MSGSARISATPPGPRGYPLLGVFPTARRDPLGFFLEAARTYGDVVGLPLGVRRLYLLSHPDHIRYVLQEDDGRFHKGPAAERIRPLFGTSLTIVDGEAWHRRRHLIRPSFTPHRLAAAVPIVVESTDVMLHRWRQLAEERRPFDVFGEMTELTRTIILRLLFGEVPDEDARTVARAVTIVAEHVNRGLWSSLGWLPSLPTPRQRHYERAVSVLDGFMSRRIGEGRQRGPAGDLLSTLLDARDAERGAGFDDTELRDELKALFVAGHATTASGLAWVWYLLSQNSNAQRRLQREARAVLGARRPSAPDLSDLKYTRLVIDETLRLDPPTWITARTTTDAVDVGAYRIPANATVLLSPYVTHRDPRFWEDAERFDPERFRHGSPARPRYAYFPFGGGPRTCIGSAFALMEMQVIVAMVAQRYELALAPGWRVEPEAGTVLVPRRGLRMMLRPGETAA